MLGLSVNALAADHAEAPIAASDPAADLADLYAWHTDSSLVLIATVAPLAVPGSTATYDSDVLYGFHVDLNGDGESDHDVWVRFGQNGAGDWGVQALGLTEDGAAVEGPVEVQLDGPSGAKLYAGPSDDPFFFDLTGFQDTLATGTIAFAGFDSFAGLNVTGIVAELPLEFVDRTSFRVWATTGRGE